LKITFSCIARDRQGRMEERPAAVVGVIKFVS